jgi:hypothetical protein
MTYDKDPLAVAGATPDIGDLLDEYNRSMVNSSQGNLATKFDNIRFCRWSGQTDDGKKWSKWREEGNPAWPFEGASDVRLRLVDSTCNELSALLVTAYQRADINTQAANLQDLPLSTIANSLMNWVRDNKMANELRKEAELAAQYALQYGWTAFYVGWEQHISKRPQSISIEQIMGLAQQAGSEQLAQLPMLIVEQPDVAASIVQAALGIDLSECKRMVKELAETGETSYDEEYVSRNLPTVQALKPWDEIIFPPETADLQRSRVIFRRTWMSEVELREKITTDGWDPNWVERALQQIGKSSTLYNINLLPTTTMLVYNGVNYNNMVEVVYAYQKSLDGKAPCIYYTVFCPQAASNRREDDASWAIYEKLDYAHGEYPFVEFRREQLRRAIADSRGIPELAMTDQDEIKAQHDSIRDYTAFATLPPIKVVKRIGAINKVGPGVQLPVTQRDDYTWMEPPAREPSTAFNLIKSVEMRHCAYFGVSHELVNPVRTQTLQQLLVNNWLMSWRGVFRQVFALCSQFLSPEEIAAITGGFQIPQNLSAIHNEFDINIRFDVKDMNPDYIDKKIQFLQTISQMDAGGAIDKNALTRMMLQAVAPEVANQLIVNQAQASQQMYKDVQSDIANMLLGNEAIYSENDPAAQTKMQFVQDIMSKNPKAQAALQQDENFKALFENYVKNIQMSLMQQQNAQIGRLGVNQVNRPA